MLKRSVTILGLVLAVAACGDVDGGMADAVDPIDGEISALSVTSPEEAAILAVANTSSFTQLDIDARLDKRAAQGIVDLRGEGFLTLEQLDKVPYVGNVAVSRLLEYAYALGMVEQDDAYPDAEPEAQPDGETVHGIFEGSAEAYGILTAANTLDFETLDNTVGLDRRAAENIVEARGAGFDSLAALDSVSYVGAQAFAKLLAYAQAAGLVVEPPQFDALIHDGEAQCSGSNTRYTYTVISNPPEAVTDGRITLRFNSSSPYSPSSQGLEIETAPNRWSRIFTTMPAVRSWQQQTVIVPAETLNAAREAMGWIRLRVNPGTAYTACSELDLTYNCPECFACPEGQEDVGFGCQEIGAPFDQTLLDHSRGMCSRSSATIAFQSAPAAGSDGSLSLEFLPCDGGRITVSLNTQNAGWVELGTASTGRSCGYALANFEVPEAYLDAARTADGRIELQYRISDSCRPGMGCASHDDPCVRRVNLNYDQE